MIRWGASYAIIGAKNSGKTVAAKNLILTPGLLGSLADIIIVFSTGGSMNQWDFLMFKNSPHRVLPTIDNELIQALFSTNEKRKKKHKTMVNRKKVY